MPPNPGLPVGIDRGIVHTLALSTGVFYDMPPLLTAGERRRLRGLERKAARQRIAHERAHKRHSQVSGGHRRTQDQIAELRARQARRRKDWCNKVTTQLPRATA